MPKKYRRVITPNAAGDDYICSVFIDGREYPYESLGRISSENGDGATRTDSIYDTETGEIISRRTKNIISENNSKAHNYISCCDFAKSKNMPREFVEARGRHIMDICREKSDYLQASAGSTHETRGIIVVDIDCEPPKGVSDRDEIIKRTNETLRKKFEIFKAVGIPYPTSYQIHTTNGHVQLFWALEHEVRIKTLKWTKRPENGIPRNYAYFENLPAWGRFMRVSRFLNVIFGGDPAFTCWQIKNMFLSDPVFAGSFKTVWNSDGVWSDAEPAVPVMYPFAELHGAVMSCIGDPASERFRLLGKILDGFGAGKSAIADAIRGNDIPVGKNVLERYGVKKNRADKSRADINLGRNQFVRMTTFEVVRAYKNAIHMDDARIIVRKRLEDELKKHGRLGGTKNNSAYTENDFERDFSGTYFYATATYKEAGKFSEEQNERSRSQRAAKKNYRMSVMLNILERHPELIANKDKNNRVIKELMAEEGITFKSTRPVYDYKKELGIASNQHVLYKRNYRKADQGYDARIKRYNALVSGYRTVDKEMALPETKRGWEKRIRDIYDSRNDSDFKKRIRGTLNLHTEKPRTNQDTPVDPDNDPFLKCLEELWNNLNQNGHPRMFSHAYPLKT